MKAYNQWASKLGFIMATAGAAVGLGNLWKFPYLMGRNGGFPFLIAYLIFVCVLGVPVMITEMSLGRKTRHDPVQATQTFIPTPELWECSAYWPPLLFFPTTVSSEDGFSKYIVSYATTLHAPADFNGFIANGTEPVVWHLIFMVATTAICFFGIRGIEKASKFMMPMLFVLLLIIIARSVTLPNAGEGLKFIFSPAGSSFSITSVSAAVGQVFYSLSLCMGITITYGSYLSDQESIPKSCASVAGLDTAVAVLAGLAIFPAVFSFGLEPGQGPGLIFGTLPKVFASIKGGSVFAIHFFCAGAVCCCDQCHCPVRGGGLLCSGQP